MNRTRKQSGAFSLLEMIIVVVIIGVIAAIAIPRMSRGARGADESALKANLAVLRSAVDLYAAEHGGNFPSGNAAEVEAQLTTYSDVSGETDATKDVSSGKIYGPYLKAVPVLPVGTKKNDDSIVVVNNAGDTPPASGTAGWWYNSATGDVRANLADTETGDEDKAYNAY